MSYYFFFSIIPCIVLATALAGSILSSGALADYVMLAINNLLPGFDQMAGDFILRIVSSAGLMGWIGTISLLWVGGYIFDITEFIISRVWKVKKPRNWFRRRIFSMMMVVLSGTLFMISTIISIAITAIRMFSIEFTQFNITLSLERFPWLWQGWITTLPFIISLLMFTLIYKMSLGRAIPWRLAGAGGLLAALLFESLKRPFLYYIVHVADYERLYGALGTIVVFFVWVHISACILLLGIEFAAAVKDSAANNIAESRMKFI